MATLARAGGLLALAAVTASGCGKKTIEAGDAAATARVVSLSPSTTEALFAIGAGPQTVGRSRYCDRPKEALALPEVGGFVDPNLEAILGLRPSLVVGARGPGGSGVTDRLAQQGIALYFPEADSLAGIDTMISGLGARLGREAQAAAVVQKLDADVAALAAAVAGEPKPRVVLVFGLDPVVLAGPGGFADELLRHAGAVNAVSDGPRYPTVGIERVLALDPDVVLNAAMAEAHGAERIEVTAPGWRELRAVKTGQVVAITDEEVLRPGPYVAEGLHTLAHALHPRVVP
jgi:iron complex transport system substrate-binding protein